MKWLKQWMASFAAWRLDYRKRHTPLHPKFRLRAEMGGVIWYQNQYVGGPLQPEYKVCFTFSDPKEMDGCTFLCKIALHKDAAGKYFGVAYPRRHDQLQAIINWSAKFESPQLFTYSGRFLQNLPARAASGEIVPENCSVDCGHKTFHYCAEFGTHCDKHCICACPACVSDRLAPAPLGPFGGKILPGAVVFGNLEIS